MVPSIDFKLWVLNGIGLMEFKRRHIAKEAIKKLYACSLSVLTETHLPRLPWTSVLPRCSLPQTSAPWCVIA